MSVVSDEFEAARQLAAQSPIIATEITRTDTSEFRPKITRRSAN